MSDLPGYHSMEISKMAYDPRRDGVWIGEDIFLPRNLIIQAVGILAGENPEKEDQRSDIASASRGAYEITATNSGGSAIIPLPEPWHDLPTDKIAGYDWGRMHRSDD